MNLHSTIFILKLGRKYDINDFGGLFTFYYIYIKTFLTIDFNNPIFVFTFYYIYIKTL